MATAIKHTNEAMAFMTLYKAMPAKVKQEVKEMIDSEVEAEQAVLFTSLSLESWDIDIAESEVWEKLYHERKRV
jgi:hypothetical protein